MRNDRGWAPRIGQRDEWRQNVTGNAGRTGHPVRVVPTFVRVSRAATGEPPPTFAAPRKHAL